MVTFMGYSSMRFGFGNEDEKLWGLLVGVRSSVSQDDATTCREEKQCKPSIAKMVRPIKTKRKEKVRALNLMKNQYSFSVLLINLIAWITGLART